MSGILLLVRTGIRVEVIPAVISPRRLLHLCDDTAIADGLADKMGMGVGVGVGMGAPTVPTGMLACRFMACCWAAAAAAEGAIIILAAVAAAAIDCICAKLGQEDDGGRFATAEAAAATAAAAPVVLEAAGAPGIPRDAAAAKPRR